MTTCVLATEIDWEAEAALCSHSSGDRESVVEGAGGLGPGGGEGILLEVATFLLGTCKVAGRELECCPAATRALTPLGEFHL